VKKLNVALVGLGGVGQEYLEAVVGDLRFNLVAVADTDCELLRATAKSTGAREYNDHRSLVVETAHIGLDMLLLAVEPFQSVELLPLAANLGVCVFHKTPFARSYAEAKALVESFAQYPHHLIVSRCWRYEPAYQQLLSLDDSVGWVFLASAHVRSSAIGRTGWSGDRVLAGGGVLLNGAYEQVDMLVEFLGVPQEVLALCGFATVPGSVRPYDTEDTAVVSMRFSDDRVVSLAAARGTPDPGWNMTLVGTDGVAEVSQDRMIVAQPGEKERERSFVKSENRFAAELGAIAAWLGGVSALAPSTGEDHLATMAVIQAAYLSAKTGSPETPTKFFE